MPERSNPELPPLPYDYDALEPAIDQRIMELHHDKHHQGYVDGANAALDKLEEMRGSSDWGDVRSVKRSLAFNLSGHVNHTVFWENMRPDGGGEPGGDLAVGVGQQLEPVVEPVAHLDQLRDGVGHDREDVNALVEPDVLVDAAERG